MSEDPPKIIDFATRGAFTPPADDEENAPDIDERSIAILETLLEMVKKGAVHSLAAVVIDQEDVPRIVSAVPQCMQDASTVNMGLDMLKTIIMQQVMNSATVGDEPEDVSS